MTKVSGSEKNECAQEASDGTNACPVHARPRWRMTLLGVCLNENSSQLLVCFAHCINGFIVGRLRDSNVSKGRFLLANGIAA
jgi:hypothetical protein